MINMVKSLTSIKSCQINSTKSFHEILNNLLPEPVKLQIVTL